MKKLILIFLAISMIACGKDDDEKPNGEPVTPNENVSQYEGRWTLNASGCSSKTFWIRVGSLENEIVVDGINGIVKDRRFKANNHLNNWDITFKTSTTADVILNDVCIGTINR